MTTHPSPPHRAPDAGAAVEQAPDMLDGEVFGGPDYARRPLPTVLPPWLGSRRTALATLRWALRYTARHLGFHLLRTPGYTLSLSWWMLRGATRALTAAWGWVSAQGEYRALIVAAREAKRWELVRDLITERRALARVRITITAWLTLSAAAATAGGVLALGTTFLECLALVAALGAVWLGRPRTAPILPYGPVLPIQLELSVDMLTAALRAAGLVKADATPQFITPPLRDGHGWAVTLDLPRGGGKTAADAIAKRDTVAAELGVDEIQLMPRSYITDSWAAHSVTPGAEPGAGMGRRGGWGSRRRSIAGSPRLGMRIRLGWIARSGCAARWPSGWDWSLSRVRCL
jgi:DNA segregation ATPase FtsK/SpoIIIE, S-DNA-T family